LQMDGEKAVISEEIQYLIKQITMNISRVLSSIIDDSPLTVHQVFIMKTIQKNAETNLTSLCKLLGLSKGALSLTINKLVKEGYVSRTEHSDDRRNVRIMLTKRGEDILHETGEKYRQIFYSLTSALTQGELSEIKENLKKLDSAIQASIVQNYCSYTTD
jgi:DNA-binding MarR family transcriptional regulator